ARREDEPAWTQVFGCDLAGVALVYRHDVIERDATKPQLEKPFHRQSSACVGEVDDHAVDPMAAHDLWQIFRRSKNLEVVRCQRRARNVGVDESDDVDAEL